jgi:universal stress protein E
MQRDRVLVVVDPAAATQPAVSRAARVARSTGWAVELLVCLHEPLPRHLARSGDARAVRRTLLAHQLGYLKDLARAHAGLDIEAKAVWDRPLHEAIIRETLRSEPRLVMKATQYVPPIARALMTQADWHLIRDCPAPLWLVRGPEWPAQPVVAAFLDPLHANDKPAALDRRILDEAGFVAERLGGTLHAVHCHDVLPAAAAVASTMPGAAEPLGAAMQAVRAEIQARLGELAAATALAPTRLHLVDGAAGEAIPAVAHQLGASLAVMGAVSRSRLEQAFVGHTAERVLDRLACDILIVKPDRFESPVTYRAQPADFMEVA